MPVGPASRRSAYTTAWTVAALNVPGREPYAERVRAGVAIPFIGREAELSRLLGALDDAAGGAGAVVLVGDAGIGKTRLAEELATQAAADGVTVCWWRCWEAGGAPPFWPWIEVLRALPGAPVELLTATAELESPDAERARFERFDAVARFLTDAAAGQPLLVVLDDAHAVDPSSLLLLELLARTVRTARVLVVAAFRPAEARGECRCGPSVGCGGASPDWS